MKFKYVRIQGRELAANTMQGRGIFSMCVDMLRNNVMEQEDAELLQEIDSWFAEELPWPEPCKRQEKVVCFFKTENSDEMIKMINPMMWLLEKYQHPYFMVYTNFPGEIVYEDKYQVCCKAEDLIIAPMQESWSPED